VYVMCLRAFMYLCACLCVCVDICARYRKCIHVSVHTYIHMYIYIFLYTYIHTYVHTYIHTACFLESHHVSYYIVLNRIISYYIVLYRITSNYTVLYRIVSYYTVCVCVFVSAVTISKTSKGLKAVRPPYNVERILKTELYTPIHLYTCTTLYILTPYLCCIIPYYTVLHRITPY
jgi:hypothetical protein